MSRYPWTADGAGRWTLDPAPRFSVVENADTGMWSMQIADYEIDCTASEDQARSHLEFIYDYEVHFADLEEARRRLAQARERIASRFPSAAKDPALTSTLNALCEAIGGPEVSASADRGDLYRQDLAPDLAVVLDASHCVVLEFTNSYGHVARRATLSDVGALHGALDTARQVRALREAEDDKRRYEGIQEHRRAQGRLDRYEAVNLLVDEHHVQRPHAVSATGSARRLYQEKTPVSDINVPVRAGETVWIVTYDGEYWGVRPSTDNP